MKNACKSAGNVVKYRQIKNFSEQGKSSFRILSERELCRRLKARRAEAGAKVRLLRLRTGVMPRGAAVIRSYEGKFVFRNKVEQCPKRAFMS